jgi:hypothetical protein
VTVAVYNRSSYEVGVGIGWGPFGYTPPWAAIEMHDNLDGIEMDLCLGSDGRLRVARVRLRTSLPAWAIDAWEAEARSHGVRTF